MKNKKLALVTGATGAIGKAISLSLVATGNYRVLMVVKNEGKALKVMEDIRRLTRSVDIRYAIADLSRKSQIIKLASTINEPVHVLVNNAATTPQNRTETPEGIEMQFAANVLGYYWMIESFTPLLKSGKHARVVNVASYWAGGLDMSDLEFKRRQYNNDSAYRQSKQADRMLSAAFSEKLAAEKISVNACHPGDVNSALSNSMGFGGSESPNQGAETPLWLATSPDVAGLSGIYFEHRKPHVCSFSKKLKDVEKLFEICGTY